MDVVFRVVTPDGRTHHRLSRCKVVEWQDGSPVRLIGTHLDVTDIEEARRDMERLNEELEGFAYSVSHDLRAPLRAIDGFARAFREDYGDQVDDEGRRMLDVISRNTNRMAQLIDDLLAFSRVSRREPDPGEVNMHALVRRVVDAALQAAPQRNIEVDLAPLPPARGDLGRLLRQVWTNVVDNSIKYSRPRDPATIEIRGEREGPWLHYTIADNGVGFDPRYTHKLFGVFQRLHKARHFEGTGVGLALCQRIIERHGGHIEANAVLDEGATITITLPAEPPL